MSGGHREALAQHPEVTFTATVRHLCCAIRKLAAHTPPEEANTMLFRGVRGALDPSFWHSADSMGLICAVDMAFMSTSKNEHTPIAYMGSGQNVLWRLHSSGDSDAAFHRGADISMFSQFAGEDEVPHARRVRSCHIADATGLKDARGFRSLGWASARAEPALCRDRCCSRR